jgi:hypothetical protein
MEGGNGFRSSWARPRRSPRHVDRLRAGLRACEWLVTGQSAFPRPYRRSGILDQLISPTVAGAAPESEGSRMPHWTGFPFHPSITALQPCRRAPSDLPNLATSCRERKPALQASRRKVQRNRHPVARFHSPRKRSMEAVRGRAERGANGMVRSGFAALALLGLAACTNRDGSVNAGRTGAVLGTAGGIVVGHQVDNGIGGAVGGVLGGAAGGEIGNRIDRR